MERSISTRDNFIWLLIALVLLLFGGAVFDQLQSQHGERLINACLLLTVIIAVWSMEENEGRWLNRKIGITLAFGVVMVSDSLIKSDVLAHAQLLMCFLFFSLTLHLAWRQVMFVGRVDGNKIVGAICIYILIGLVWAFAYLIAEEIFPGSFKGLTETSWQKNIDDVLYYSMVTLTTLGYGDITPVQPLTRFLAYMEAITGIFFTTVLVASLIGLRLASYRPGSTESPRDEDANSR